MLVLPQLTIQSSTQQGYGQTTCQIERSCCMSYSHADGALRFPPPPFPHNKYRLRHGSESVLNLAINQSATLSAEFYYPPARVRLKRGDGFDPPHVHSVVHGHCFRYCYMHPAHIFLGWPWHTAQVQSGRRRWPGEYFLPQNGTSLLGMPGAVSSLGPSAFPSFGTFLCRANGACGLSACVHGFNAVPSAVSYSACISE